MSNPKPLTYDEARSRTDKLKKSVRDVDKEIAALYNAKVWLSLGYPNWDAYVAAESIDGALVRVPRENRTEMVRSLSLTMGVRPIAAALGISRETARRALQGDTNVSPPEPKPKPIPKPDRYLQQVYSALVKYIDGAVELDRLCRDRRFLIHRPALVKAHGENVIVANEVSSKLVPHFADPDVILLDDDGGD